MRNLVGNNKQFPLLFKVARLMLAPHSNASIERVFSTVNKSKGKGSDRNHLNIEGSLSSILPIKMDRLESISNCYEFEPSEKLLAAAKKAT